MALCNTKTKSIRVGSFHRMALRAKKLYDSGLTLAEVGNKCGMRTGGAIRDMFAARGWPRRPTGTQMATTLQMYEDHKLLGNVAAVARKHGLAPSSVYSRFTRATLPWRVNKKTLRHKMK